MTERKLMPREEVFKYVSDMASALFAGKPAPKLPASADHMRAEDLLDASDAFMRSLSERLDAVPSKASADPMIQEALRHELDSVMAAAALQIRDMVASMPKRDLSK